MDKLNEALRLMRVFHDLSQKELAEKLRISKSYISEIESGKKTPTLDLLNRYSEFFDIPVSSIMFFSESLNSKEIKTFPANKILAMLTIVVEK